MPRVSTPEGRRLLGGKRLLVVDDHATNREIVSRQVRAWGMRPLGVEHPSEALALIEAGEPFDVVILDMQMPEMDGLALAREIKRHRPDLPLVLVTSLGGLPEARSSTEFAAQLTKPLRASQLFDALMSVFAEDAEHAAGGGERRRREAGVDAAHPAGRGQRREPEARAQAPGAARLRGRSRGERPGGARGARAAAL